MNILAKADGNVFRLEDERRPHRLVCLVVCAEFLCSFEFMNIKKLRKKIDQKKVLNMLKWHFTDHEVFDQ